MKNLGFLAAMLLLFPGWALAKAYFQGRDEMVTKARAIAIVTISDVEDSEAKGQHWTYRKKGNAKVETILKGEVPPEFFLYGMETFLCASCPIAEGRFLVFLKPDGELWTGSNWHLSLRKIESDSVPWYGEEDGRFDMKATPLPTVLAEIKAILARETTE